MSLARQHSLFSSVSSTATPSQHAPVSIMAILLLMAAKINALQQTLSQEILDPVANTLYRLDYPNTAPFTQIPNRMAETCKMIVAAFPENSTEYELAVTPTCTWQGKPTGPSVELLVENGRDLSMNVADCLTKVMNAVCDIYNRDHHRPTSSSGSDTTLETFLWVGGALLLLSSICTMIYCCSVCSSPKKNDQHTRDLEAPLMVEEHHHDSSATDACLALGACCVLLGTVASLSNTANQSSQSSSSSSSDSGVTMTFAKRPR